MVSDIVLLEPLPRSVQKSVEAYSGCVAGAEIKDKYIELIRNAGFQEVKVLEEKNYPLEYIVSENTLKDAIKLTKITDQELKARQSP